MNDTFPDCVIETPVGKLGVFTEENSVSGLRWLSQQTRLKPPKGRFVIAVCGVLFRYFRCSDDLSAIPLKLKGTRFQIRVWFEMQNIPVGAVVTYG